MDRIRRSVLVGLAGATVLVFALAPDHGRAARVPLMVMIAVLAVIWHLAVGQPAGQGIASGLAPSAEASPTPMPTPTPTPTLTLTPPPAPVEPPAGAAAPAVGATERRPGYFELASSSQPEPAASEPAPPTVVEAQASPPDEVGSEDDEVLPPPPAFWPTPGVQVPMAFQDTVIDLTDDGPILAPLGPEQPAVQPAVPSATASAPDDPWLAFAAKMFGGD